MMSAEGFDPMILDMIAIGIILIGCGYGAFRGLLVSAFNLFSSVIALIIANILTPTVTKLIISSPLEQSIADGIAQRLMLNTSAPAATQPEQLNIINSLPLPDTLRDLLLDNNNSVMYEILGVNTFIDYISHYLAGIVVRALSTLAVFVISFAAVRLISCCIKVFSSFVVIKQLNLIGGAIVGGICSIVFLWIAVFCIQLFVGQPFFTKLCTAMEQSNIVVIFYAFNPFKLLI